MRTIFERIRLTVDTQKNALPAGKTLFGSLKFGNNLESARFREEPYPFETILRKSLRLRHGKGYTLSFNPEKNMYRITINVNADNPDWNTAAVNFANCWECLEEREGL